MPGEDAWLLSRPLAAPPKAIIPGKLGAGRERNLNNSNTGSNGKGMEDGEEKGKRKEKKEDEEKRKVVTLEDVRRKWQEELDRRADLRAGRFAAFDFVGWVGGGDAGGDEEDGVSGGSEAMES